ncbi:MAG: site-specific integrase [Bacteroidetes bacterium]|nr:site-specific integrase [Bacteroidota bacterium]
MAGSVTFILKDPQAKNETPIYLVYWYKDTRIKLSTGEKIDPDNWNPEKHRARVTKQFDQAENLNTRLKDIETGIMNTVRDHMTKRAGVIILDQLTDEFRPILKPSAIKTVKKHTFLSAVKEYIATTNKNPRTIVSYNSTLNTLTDYQNANSIELSMEDINMDFYESFMTYLLTIKKFAPNTIGGHIKQIKVFMNYCLDKGYTLNRGHLHRKFSKPEETADTIYLNDNDLLTLYELDLSENKKLDRVRDLFLIGCYTGLRFSDLSQLSPDKFIKNGTRLKVKTIKTGETVVIPLHWTIKEILKKYNGGTPRPISNQRMNDYLKKLCDIEHFREKVVLNKTKGGLSFEQKKEKGQLVTVHTARRSFATNMYLAEVPAISIMKITGHRTERAFMKYIKITQEQNADKLSVHPYFIKPLKKVGNK